MCGHGLYSYFMWRHNNDKYLDLGFFCDKEVGKKNTVSKVQLFANIMKYHQKLPLK